jgi:hypothetical protein
MNTTVIKINITNSLLETNNFIFFVRSRGKICSVTVGVRVVKVHKLNLENCRNYMIQEKIYMLPHIANGTT